MRQIRCQGTIYSLNGVPWLWITAGPIPSWPAPWYDSFVYDHEGD